MQTFSPFYTLVQRSERDNVMEIQVMVIQVMEIQVTEIQVPRSSQRALNVTVCDVSKHDSASMFTVKQAGTK